MSRDPFMKTIECKIVSLSSSGGCLSNSNIACSILFHSLDLIDLSLSSLSVGQSVWCVVKHNFNSNKINAFFISSSEQITQEKWEPEYKCWKEKCALFAAERKQTNITNIKPKEFFKNEADFITQMQLTKQLIKYSDAALCMD